MTAFWDTALHNLDEVDRYFRGAYSPHHEGYNEGNMHLWNISILPQDYMALHPRKLPSSCICIAYDKKKLNMNKIN